MVVGKARTGSHVLNTPEGLAHPSTAASPLLKCSVTPPHCDVTQNTPEGLAQPPSAASPLLNYSVTHDTPEGLAQPPTAASPLLNCSVTNDTLEGLAQPPTTASHTCVERGFGTVNDVARVLTQDMHRWKSPRAPQSYKCSHLAPQSYTKSRLASRPA